MFFALSGYNPCLFSLEDEFQFSRFAGLQFAVRRRALSMCAYTLLNTRAKYVLKVYTMQWKKVNCPRNERYSSADSFSAQNQAPFRFCPAVRVDCE